MTANIAVLITCHNRRRQTLACLESLFSQMLAAPIELTVWLVDDGSTDGTSEIVAKSYPQVRRLRGSGDLFWCGGMALAWSNAASGNPDAFLWLNDDVVLLPGAIASLQGLAQKQLGAVLVGSCRSPETGARTYGGLQRLGLHPAKLGPVEPGSHPIPCDTFQGNIVWVPATTFARVGAMASFRHSMGDIDYGYRAAEAGIPLLVAPGFLGLCSANSHRGTWEDRKLGRRERWIKLRSTKGLPSRDWWRFCRRNGGVRAPLYFVTPFLRILVGR